MKHARTVGIRPSVPAVRSLGGKCRQRRKCGCYPEFPQDLGQWTTARFGLATSQLLIADGRAKISNLWRRYGMKPAVGSPRASRSSTASRIPPSLRVARYRIWKYNGAAAHQSRPPRIAFYDPFTENPSTSRVCSLRRSLDAGQRPCACAAEYIWIEGESPQAQSMTRHPWWYDQVKRDQLSGGDFISNWNDKRAGEATYGFRAGGGQYVSGSAPIR